MDPSFLPATELGRGLAQGRWTSEELVNECLERIHTYDPLLRGFVEVYDDAALEAARASDKRRSQKLPLGILDGVPVAVKDSFDVAGHPTRCGSKATSTAVATKTATAVRRLLSQGMILIGKTHTVEFAYGSWGTNPSCGTPVNPYDRDTQRVTGGSSSGSAVAVAAGLVPVALGTDTGGSVRTPAALCGIIGLKTSVGLIGRGGLRPLALVFDNVGIMTRSTEDAALLMAALHGEDPDDPSTFGITRFDPLVSLNKSIDGLVFRHPPLAELQVAESGVLARFTETAAALHGLGAIIEERQLPRPLETYATLSANFTTIEAWDRLHHLIEIKDSLVDTEIATRMSRGKTMTIADHLANVELRSALQSEFHHYLQGADALLLPTSPITARVIEGAHSIPAPFGVFTRIANLLDLAAVSVPMGDVGGLPTGFQILVRRFADPLALRIARALEAKRGGLFKPPVGFTPSRGCGIGMS